MQARDSILSVGLGRPRAIIMKECTVKAPSTDDFYIVDAKCHLFIAHVSISRCMGSIAEAHRQRRLTDDRRQSFEDVLYRWVHQLPRALRLFVNGPDKALADRHLANLQLHVPYFVCLLMLYKDAKPDSPEATAALIAASFIVGVLEDIMARDEVRYLPAIFPFYALAAGLVGLSSYRYPALRLTAEHEFAVIKMVLEQLGHRWQSAKSALVALTNACEMIRKQPSLDTEPNPLSANLNNFFETFGPDLCRCWNLQAVHAPMQPPTMHEECPRVSDVSRPSQQWEQRTMTGDQELMPDGHDYALPGLGLPPLDDALPPVGSWLFDEVFFTDHMGLP